MTQDQIDEIKRLEDQKYRLWDRYKAEEESLRKRIRELDDRCDHKYPDGSSAVEGGMFCSTCRICHESDM